MQQLGVCDGRTLRTGQLNGVVGTPNDYRWSADNLAEVRRGWITPAAGPGELADRLSVDASVLTVTLAEFNAAPSGARSPTPTGA